MADAAQDPPIPPSPGLAALFWVFLAIGMQSFGGGMSAWMRREVVHKRRWMSEQAFVGGLALCQIAPGPNGVNLAVFIGTTLRGRLGAVASLGGMLLVPVIVVLALGAGFTHIRDVPGVESAMTGLGAAAIGLNLATGLRMMARNIRAVGAGVVMVATALAAGWFGVPLPLVLLVAAPLSLMLARGRA